MMPTLADGDYVVLSPLDPYKPHGDRLKDSSIVLIRFTLEHGGGYTLARFFDNGKGTIRLQKDNPKYEPIQCDREHIPSVTVAVER